MEKEVAFSLLEFLTIDSRDWIVFEGAHIRCKICNTIVERGIISVSTHWANCQGKNIMKYINQKQDEYYSNQKDKNQ